MTSYFEDVKTFHQELHLPISEVPILFDSLDWVNRIRLISEEWAETVKAYALDDLEGFADGLVDLTWVVLGTAVEAGLPFDELWAEVRQANMNKKGGKLDASGKLLKPDGWKPPNIKRIMDAAQSGGGRESGDPKVSGACGTQSGLRGVIGSGESCAVEEEPGLTTGTWQGGNAAKSSPRSTGGAPESAMAWTATLRSVPERTPQGDEPTSQTLGKAAAQPAFRRCVSIFAGKRCLLDIDHPGDCAYRC